MKEIVAPAGKRLVWYLAMEEYLAQHVGEEMLFFWVVPPTVIFGRHQVMANEVNVDYCREHAVQMYLNAGFVIVRKVEMQNDK